MKKRILLWIALDLVFLIVFNIVFFVAGGAIHPVSVWISYAFIHFAYLMVLVTPFLTRKSSSATVFGFSIYAISSAYFLVELIVGIIFIFLKQDSYKPALLVQIVLAGIYAIILISHLIANESTADSIERHEQGVAYIKEASSRVKPMIGKLSDKKANREIEKLYDLLHTSPSKSSVTVYSLEISIMEMIENLESNVASNNTESALLLVSKITTAVEERNRKLRQLN